MIHHILSFPGIRDSVSTSLLSRRCRHLWHFVPSLDITGGYRGDEELPPDLSNQALILHAAPEIDRFRLKTRVTGEKAHLWPPPIDAWLLFAVLRGVLVLDLDFTGGRYKWDQYPNPGFSYRLLPFLFECESLTDLTARFCRLRLPDHACLSSLKTMHFDSMRFRGDELKLLLSGCPLLQSLKLVEDCNMTSNINVSACENHYLENLKISEGLFDLSKLGMKISAPSVKDLNFVFDFRVARQRYAVRDLSSLVIASFWSRPTWHEDPGAAFDIRAFPHLLCQIPQVQVLRMCSCCSQWMQM